jgi:hypothetical protein
MQIVAVRASDYASLGPVRPFLEAADRETTRAVAQRFANLLSSGVARAPAYERNQMLTSLVGQDGPALADGQKIAEAVAMWLSTGRLGRCRLGQQRVDETHTMATLLRDAWRKHPEMRPILVEGSPDAPHAKAIGNVRVLRRTHHFVLLRMRGRLHVIDGARALVFDSLRTYLNTVMLPGRRGGSSMRMKWFRIFDGGREMGQEDGESVN